MQVQHIHTAHLTYLSFFLFLSSLLSIKYNRHAWLSKGVFHLVHLQFGRLKVKLLSKILSKYFLKVYLWRIDSYFVCSYRYCSSIDNINITVVTLYFWSFCMFFHSLTVSASVCTISYTYAVLASCVKLFFAVGKDIDFLAGFFRLLFLQPYSSSPPLKSIVVL